VYRETNDHVETHRDDTENKSYNAEAIDQWRDQAGPPGTKKLKKTQKKR
jgi:hypothetical protein